MNMRKLLQSRHELYRNTQPGNRVQKWTIEYARRYKALYLPCLEVRTTYTDNRQTENLRVITVNGIRILYWQQGKPEGIERYQLRFSTNDRTGSSTMELDSQGKIISQEKYYPYGGTAIWATRNQVDCRYKTIRYSGNERDVTGLIHYAFRYFVPWLMRWLNTDPAGAVDGLNLFRMVKNNPMTLKDHAGLAPVDVSKLNTTANYEEGVKKESDLYIGQLHYLELDELYMEKNDSPPVVVNERILNNLVLAQNTNNLTKKYLPYGSTNMMIDIWRTEAKNLPLRRAARALPDYSPINTAIKYGVGNCGEHAHISFSLLAWQGLNDPVHLIEDRRESHSYVLIGDMRETSNSVVVDSWVTLPTAHLLNESGSIIKPSPRDIVKSSPVGYKHDPRYAIDDSLNNEPHDIPPPLYTATQYIRTNKETLWSEFTSMETVDNTYKFDGRFYRFDQYSINSMDTLLNQQRNMNNVI